MLKGTPPLRFAHEGWLQDMHSFLDRCSHQASIKSLYQHALGRVSGKFVRVGVPTVSYKFKLGEEQGVKNTDHNPSPSIVWYKLF
jgi:hypothetical protein